MNRLKELNEEDEYLEQTQKPTWDVYFMAYYRIQMFPEKHLYKLRKDIEINHEKVAKETIMDESTVVVDGDMDCQ